VSKYDNKMNKIIVAAISVIVVFFLFYTATSYAECDGKLVRGLFGFECIESHE